MSAPTPAKGHMPFMGHLNFAAFFGRHGAAKKQPGLSTELKEMNMSTVLDLVTPVRAKKQPQAGTVHWLDECVELSKSGIFSEVALLTPGLADVLIQQRNRINRPLRKVKLNQFSRDMSAGKWTLNGEALIIANDGSLNDGQHRCHAVIDANTPVPVLFTFGPEPETRLTLDQGSMRSASDFLGMEGVPNAALQAAIGRMVIAYHRSGGKDLNAANQVTSSEVRERVAIDPDISVAATFGHTNGRYSKAFAAGSVIGFAYYLLAEVDSADASDWLERVCRGDGLKIGHPAHTLREKLHTEGKSRDRKITMILKAWNFHRRGMKVSANTLQATLPFPALVD